MISCKAPAKINLALHVTGQRPDGYHLLDTLAGFCNIGDVVQAQRADGTSHELEILGPFSASLQGTARADNLVMRAAESLMQFAASKGCATFPAKLTLEKNLPVASGMGGGSADAAASLLALARLWDLPKALDLASVAASLGADVPMCMASQPLRATGIGERIELLGPQQPIDVVLVNPGVAIATPAIFARLENRNNPAIGTHPLRAFEPAWLSQLRNDLETPARKLAPVINEVLSILGADDGARLVRMSGSGATCFALHESRDSALAAASRVLDRHPDWWCVATQIEGLPIANRLRAA
ncbi:MAG: 4-(cytidine 5'-diphospho)-2-C-methyl-D-erythritol kinase [Nitratireductor sp.]